jgi:superfamily I DNA/RNA helicase
VAFQRIHDDAVVRRADLIQLEQIAAGYRSREHFLTELTLDPPEATSDQAGVPLLEEDYLILSTIHSAKGQEWRSVFVLNVVDGCIPSDLGTGTAAEIEFPAPAHGFCFNTARLGFGRLQVRLCGVDRSFLLGLAAHFTCDGG